jgi:nucleoside-diphosphate-sugar epimerase
MKYAIFGATGAVGKALAAELAKTGTPFRVVGRSMERLRRDFGAYEPLVEFVAADLNDPQGAANAAAGVDTIFYLVGVPYTQFKLHPKLTRIALDAAASAGVKRFIHLGTVYPYGKPERDLVDESHPRNPHTFKGRMRKEQEDLVLAADGRSGMRTTILRPPDFYGPESELSYARAIFDAALQGGTANVIGPIKTPHEFIFVPDVAATLVALSEKDEAYGQAWNVAGPGLISTRRFAELVFRAVQQRPRLRAANKMMLRVMGLFNPFLREIAEMHYLWTTPVALDDSRLRRLLPNLRKTSYENGIQATLNSMRSGTAGGEKQPQQ